MRPADAWAREALEALDARGLLRSLESLEGRQGARVRIAGREYVNFTSNDYLGLCGDDRLVRASMAALERYGSGGGASRLLAGGSEVHDELESALAGWMGSERAVLFNTGYAANVGVMQALAGPGDEIFSDALNHASIVDGCRLSRATVNVYPHADVSALAKLLVRSTARRRLVVTDSLFSMDGDHAPLEQLAALCDEHGAALIVDEAHALGVFDNGLCGRLGLGDAVDVRVGTLGKSLGSSGAFAAASKAVCDLLINRARSLVFSTMFPPSVAAAALAAVRIVETDPSLRNRLAENVALMAQGLRQLGFAADESSPIFPVIIGEPERAVQASAFLRERGLLVKPIRPPTVPVGTSRLRITLTAAHTPSELDRLLAALGEWKESADVR